MKHSALISVLVLLVAVAGGMGGNGVLTVASAESTYDISTLAGKVASVNGTAGLHNPFSGLVVLGRGGRGHDGHPPPLFPLPPSLVPPRPPFPLPVPSPPAAPH